MFRKSLQSKIGQLLRDGSLFYKILKIFLNVYIELWKLKYFKRDIYTILNQKKKIVLIFRTGNSNTYTGKANPDYFRNPSVMDFRLNSRWTPSPSSWISNRIPSSFTRMLPGSGQYHILNTDYTNYAIMWSCSDMGMLHTGNIYAF